MSQAPARGRAGACPRRGFAGNRTGGVWAVGDAAPRGKGCGRTMAAGKRGVLCGRIIGKGRIRPAKNPPTEISVGGFFAGRIRPFPMMRPHNTPRLPAAIVRPHPFPRGAASPTAQTPPVRFPANPRRGQAPALPRAGAWDTTRRTRGFRHKRPHPSRLAREGWFVMAVGLCSALPGILP